jgi:hypothetical protein
VELGLSSRVLLLFWLASFLEKKETRKIPALEEGRHRPHGKWNLEGL